MIDHNIGFIGLGNVGSKLANSIIQADYNLFIYDKDKNTSNELVKKGAIWKNSVKDIIDNTSLPHLINQDCLASFVLNIF